MEWIHSIADFWSWLTGLFGNSEIISGVTFLVLVWIVATVFFCISFLRHKLFRGEPPDEFTSYVVPALFLTFLGFGGMLVLSSFTR